MNAPLKAPVSASARRPYGSWVGTGVLASASVFGAQIALATVVWIVMPSESDTYYAWGPAVGLVCVVPLFPLFLGLAGFAHAIAIGLPALALGRRAALRRPPEWGWSAVAAVGLSAVYAVLPWKIGAGYLESWLWLGGAGVLPALIACWYVRRAQAGLLRSRWRLIWQITLATAAGAALAAGLSVLGIQTGLLKSYAPPEFSRDQAVGVWQGKDDDSIVVRLNADGRALVTELPHDSHDGYATEFCSGSGTWAFEEGTSTRRDGVSLSVNGCPSTPQWEISGTKEQLELFMVLGDPDSGDLYVLRKQP
ncbi:hypothetical protein AB0M39_39950 [Streptomyces sp. NPDC051907]|uniref:hypothetical protein n=1 Tax=Streptomyces sp. NPDC051907 TaxID=3155284 RepID=UPI003413FFF3